MQEKVIRALQEEHIIEGDFDILSLDKGIDSKNYLITIPGNHSQSVLKIYPAPNIEEVSYEVEILNELTTQFSQPYFPTLLRDIFYIEKQPTILLNYVSGKMLNPEDINTAMVSKIAIAQAKMHRVLLDFMPVHKKSRFPIFDFGFVELFTGYYEGQYKVIIDDEMKELKEMSVSLHRVNARKTIIHEDLTMDNVIVDSQGTVNFIDFGESHRAEAISDIATAVKELLIKAKGVDFGLITQYLDSYQTILGITKDELSFLPFLLRRRGLFMITYLIHKQEVDETTELDERINSELESLQLLQSNIDAINDFVKGYCYE